MLDRDFILGRLTENFDIFSEFAIARFGLFGSYAKGSAHANSDMEKNVIYVSTNVDSVRTQYKINHYGMANVYRN